MTRVLLTGAAGGIGTALARRLRERGARVIGLDLLAGPDIVACDIRDQASVDRRGAEAIGKLGGLDVLINNAGLGLPQSAGAPPGEDAQSVIDVNLLGPWRVTSAALPALRASRGRVVNVASGLAHLTVPFATAYCMSKRGLTAYSDSLRLEHGDAITVTTVYPGYIRTPIHDESRAAGIGLEGRVPAERVEDAARTIARAALGPPVRDVATTRQPRRVVVDRHAQTPVSAKVLAGDGALIVTAGERNAQWPANVEMLSLPDGNGRVDLTRMLRELAARGVNELHVEAGFKLDGSLLREGLVDEFLVYMAPRLLGVGRELAAFGPLERLEDTLDLRFTSVTPVGDDLRLIARPRPRA